MFRKKVELDYIYLRKIGEYQKDIWDVWKDYKVNKDTFVFFKAPYVLSLWYFSGICRVLRVMSRKNRRVLESCGVNCGELLKFEKRLRSGKIHGSLARNELIFRYVWDAVCPVAKTAVYSVMLETMDSLR